MGPALDTKPYVEPDPILGYRYTPNTRMTLPKPGGGQYSLAINADGIRSDREYSRAKPSGTYRIIACGDSMAAGQFVNNSNRFSEQLERRVPRLEVINLALEGSGTDQQLLLYEHVGLKYEHDAVMLLPFLQNIRRNLAAAREAIEPSTGRIVLRPKPRFELVGDTLEFHPPEDAAGIEETRTDTAPSAAASFKKRLNRVPGASWIKRLLYRLSPWEPFPEYRDPNSHAWRLMAALIARMKQLAGERPLIIVPTFYSGYVRYRMARNYWTRFASLDHPPHVYAIDVLPHFQAAAGGDGSRLFQEPYDMHFSVDGHLVLADAVRGELMARGVLRDDGQSR